jgi:tetratricopeptide (TPR) repeat protein
LQDLARVEEKPGRVQSAQKCLEDALELANVLGDPQIRASVHFHVGMFCAEWRGAEGAEAALDLALAAYGETGDRLGKARCLAMLAKTYLRQRRHDEATKTLETCRALFLELGDVAEAAIVSLQMADVLVARGKYSQAAESFREQIGTLRRHGSVANQGDALLGLGNAVGRGGDLVEARDCFAEARRLFVSIGDRASLARSDTMEGEVLVRLGREAEGAALIRRGFDTYDALGVLGANSPDTVAENMLARITRQIADTHGCS